MGTSKAQVEALNLTNLPDNPVVKIRSVKHREVNSYLLAYAGNCFVITVGSDGTSFTSLLMANREVAAVCINDNMKNTGFEKETTESDTLTFTDGTTLLTGDKVTVWLSI